jgi:putative DNA primase/helicase
MGDDPRASSVDLDELRREIEAEEAREAEEFEAWEKEQAAKRKGKDKPPESIFSFREIVQAFHDNEAGDAALVVRLLGGRYCQDNLEAIPYRMNCTHWEADVNREHQRAIRAIAEEFRRLGRFYQAKAREALNMGVPKGELKQIEKRMDAFFGRAKTILADRRANAIWRMSSCGEGSLGVDGTAWNRHPTLLPCKNCIVDLETGKPYAKGHAHELFFNKASPVDYLGTTQDAGPWDDLLEKVLCRNRDVIDYFGLLAGFAATGLQTKDFCLLFGPGGDNGKSVVTDWMCNVLGSMAGTIPVELLLEERFLRQSSAPNSEIVKLRGMRLAVFSEAQGNHRFSVAAVKRYTAGGDVLTARLPYATWPVEFSQTHTLLGHTNAIPQAAGSDNAFFNRLRIFFCGARFIAPEEGDEDPGGNVYHKVPRWKLDRDLEKVRSGILSWFVRMAMAALKLGDMPRPPSAVLQETKEYRSEQDLVGQFLGQCCVEKPESDAKEQMRDLHAAFRAWQLKEQGFTEKNAWSVRALASELKGRPGIERESGRVIHYRGVQLLRDWAPGGLLFEGGKARERSADDDVPF